MLIILNEFVNEVLFQTIVVPLLRHLSPPEKKTGRVLLLRVRVKRIPIIHQLPAEHMRQWASQSRNEYSVKPILRPSCCSFFLNSRYFSFSLAVPRSRPGLSLRAACCASVKGMSRTHRLTDAFDACTRDAISPIASPWDLGSLACSFFWSDIMSFSNDLRIVRGLPAHQNKANEEGAPGQTRTANPLRVRKMLCPIELQEQFKNQTAVLCLCQECIIPALLCQTRTSCVQLRSYLRGNNT